MYKFITDIKKEDYDNVYNSYNSYFVQSYDWGQFIKKNKNQKPYYVGVKKNGKLKCVALLLENKNKLGLKYITCHFGPIIDYHDKDLLTFFLDNIKEYVKTMGVIYLRINPNLEYQEIDKDANPVENGYNNKDIFNLFIECGFKHTGFHNNFEGIEPRNSFIIDLSKSNEELDKNINKSVMKKIRKTYDYEMVLEEKKNVDTFYNLIQGNAQKNDFISYKKSYYQNTIDMMNGTFKLHEISINPQKLYKKFQSKLKETDEKDNDAITRIKKELEMLEDYKDLTNLILCSQITVQNKETMWLVYIGNESLGQNMYAVNRMYYEMIKYAKEEGLKYLDLYGTCGDPKNAIKNYAGMHKYKENFGGKYIEYCGEFDYVYNRTWYKLLPILTKTIKKLRKIKNKLIRK